MRTSSNLFWAAHQFLLKQPTTFSVHSQVEWSSSVDWVLSMHQCSIYGGSPQRGIAGQRLNRESLPAHCPHNSARHTMNFHSCVKYVDLELYSFFYLFLPISFWSLIFPLVLEVSAGAPASCNSAPYDFSSFDLPTGKIQFMSYTWSSSGCRNPNGTQKFQKFQKSLLHNKTFGTGVSPHTLRTKLGELKFRKLTFGKLEFGMLKLER